MKFLTIVICASLFLSGCGPDYVKARPDDADVAGTYKLAKLKIDNDLARSVRERDVTLTLMPDHKVVVADFPKFDLTGGRLICRLSGSAEWQLSDQENGGVGWSLVFNNFNSSTSPTNNVCNTTYPLPSLLLLNQKAPHRLYMTVGDPSGDEGIEFAKSAS